MNHLRALLDLKLSELAVFTDTEDAAALEAMHLLHAVGPQAMCFYMGHEGDGLESISWEQSLCVLPYETCWFEFSVDGGFWGVLVTTVNGLTQIVQFVRYEQEWALGWLAQCRVIGDLVQYIPVSNRVREQVPDCLAGVAAFLTAMNCTNVHHELHNPDQALQKARSKRGKAPLFSYWTLQLKSGNGSGPPLGGTHASPRLHLRRGHARQYAPGMYTWVQAAMVGNKAAGMVHKDYAVTPGLITTAQSRQRQVA